MSEGYVMKHVMYKGYVMKHVMCEGKHRGGHSSTISCFVLNKNKM